MGQEAVWRHLFLHAESGPVYTPKQSLWVDLNFVIIETETEYFYLLTFYKKSK